MAILGETQEVLLKIPPETNFFSTAKLILTAIAVFIWAFPAAWSSYDARRMLLNSYIWGLLIMTGAVLGMFFLLFMPIYPIGLILFLLISFGCILAYAIHRDGLVEENDKILNLTNLWLAITGKRKREFKLEEKVKIATVDGYERPVPEEYEKQRVYQAVQDILFEGLWKRAETIYLKPTAEDLRVYFVVDGFRSEQTRLDKNLGRAVIDYIKSCANLDLSEKRKPQKATLVIQQIQTGQNTTIDIESSGSSVGEAMIIKVRTEISRLTVDELGFTEDQLIKIKEAIDAKSGIFVISGMPKSGLSTTLYAIARSLDAFMQNIHTAEKKPLMSLDSITQNIFDPQAHESFATLIRSIARREADVILVDDCDDPSVAQMIAQIATAKSRKIYTTLHASSASSAINRIVRWIDEPNLAAESLLLVTFQRLVRKLCTTCREPYKPNPELLRKFNLPTDRETIFYRPPTQLVDKKGNVIICPSCQGSGYRGRIAIFEVIPIDEKIKQAIKSKDAVALNTAIKRSKHKSWEQVAIGKVLDGTTSLQEIARVLQQDQKNKK